MLSRNVTFLKIYELRKLLKYQGIDNFDLRLSKSLIILITLEKTFISTSECKCHF